MRISPKNINYEVILPTQYKGDRQYVHSSDLYLAIDAVAKERFGVLCWVKSLTFRDLVTSQCKVVFDKAENKSVEHSQACCTISAGDNLIFGDIVATGEPIIGRVPFNEDTIKQSAVVKESSIHQEQRAGFTPIEELVSLTKLLHNSILPKDKGKWVFSSIDLIRDILPDAELCFDVSLVQNLAGRVTISEIRQGSNRVGTIKFIGM